MKYQLTMIEKETINGKTKERKDITNFDHIEAAKCWADQLIIALNVNVKKKCAIECIADKEWKKKW